jgi:hypothetical protein
LSSLRDRSQVERRSLVCLAAALVASLGLPALHRLVHLSEGERGQERKVVELRGGGRITTGPGRRSARRASTRSPSASGRAHLAVAGADHHHGSGRHHEHGDDRRGSPLEHGEGAAEHLGVALLESAPPELPRAWALAEPPTIARTTEIRGPPAAMRC